MIGGGLVEAGELLLAPTRSRFVSWFSPRTAVPRSPSFRPSLGGDAGAIGAALVGFDRADLRYGREMGLE